METLNEWFFFKTKSANYKPNVQRDRDAMFCHDNIQAEIESRIERAFATAEPIKMMLYGDWGVGKTHAAYHIAWWMSERSSEFPATICMVELGDVTKKSRFDVLVRRFLDDIGIAKITEMVHAYQPKVGRLLVPSLLECGVPKIVAEAFGKFLLATPGQTPPPVVLQTFNYLKGADVRDAAAIGLGEALKESEDLYGVLAAVGELYRAVDNRQMIFIADEAAKLEAVDGDEATRAHWISVNRLIFDDNNTHFGFVYTLSAKGWKNVSPVLTDPQIQNRLGKSNYIELMTLPPADVKTFVERLMSDFTDFAKVDAAVASGTIDAAIYSRDAYPFTADAKSDFIDYWNMNQKDSKPRDISDRLNDLAFLALKKGKRLIDRECLRAAEM
jgi:hypothetical protein